MLIDSKELLKNLYEALEKEKRGERSDYFVYRGITIAINEIKKLENKEDNSKECETYKVIDYALKSYRKDLTSKLQAVTTGIFEEIKREAENTSIAIKVTEIETIKAIMDNVEGAEG